MEKAKIYYHDIGDYLSREEKLSIIKEFGSIENVPWTEIVPDEHGDWINHRNDAFETFIPLEPDKKFNKNSESFFMVNSRGNETGRDAWMYNFSREKLDNNINTLVGEYANNRGKKLVEELNYDETKISWTSSLISKALKNEYINNEHIYALSFYRPFVKQITYRGVALIHRIGQLKKLFPTSEHENLLICVSGIGVTKDFSCIITNLLPDLELIGKSQCFPLYWYEEEQETFESGGMDNMFGNCYIRHDGVTDWILSSARKQYGDDVTKEDVFYYVYGLLHSPEYRTTFANDLKKSLPRLPLVKSADDFWTFSRAGREFAALHLNYETIEPYRGCTVTDGAYANRGDAVNYRVEKMRFGKIDSKTADKSIIHYNDGITISDVPTETYEYVINGKSAIEWIMERYAVTTDKKSGITNDPNDWAREHGDEKYIFNLLLRIITLSLKTTAIVKSLPTLNFE